MKVTSKGQVTIPIALREQFGIFPDTEVEFFPGDNQIILRKKSTANSRGKKLIEAMRGTATLKMTTDEIMALTRAEPEQ
ncbi:MAG: AbrB/MazE/SpoVT family DNA-binding domain-containing protein [Pirellulales bacterium]|nr:AbrB/MazE/SpoVT family DNA-binding domain-containing protein [Pirellulales bacterium]